MTLTIRPEHAAAAASFDSLEGRDLLLLLHGLGSHERDLLPLVQGMSLTDAALAPRAPHPWGPGFAWATPTTESDAGRGVGLGPSAEAVLTWLDGLEARWGHPRRVRLLGFSQGGALALELLRMAEQRFERVVVLSGFVVDEPREGDRALAEHRPAVFWGRGDADPIIPADAVERTRVWLDAHADATVHRYAGLGHSVSLPELADVAAFLADVP